MGTRSITDFVNANGKVILTIYRHYDGYPEGHGAQLVLFASNSKFTNGVPPGSEFGKVFNGFEDFVAQCLVYLKGTDVGNIYVIPPEADNRGEEYAYIVKEVTDGVKIGYYDVYEGMTQLIPLN